MVSLSSRLSLIKSLVPFHCVPTDVGADHGKLIISLIEDNIIDHGYAVENKMGPFSILEKEIINSGYQGRITPFYSDGISLVMDDCDTLIIAGMGGHLIKKILSKHPENLKNIKTIIVDPHNDIPGVREFIQKKLHFGISKEIILKEDNVYYELIRFENNAPQYLDEIDLTYGPLLRREKSETFIKKYQERITQIDTLIIKGLPASREKELLKEKERLLSLL